MFHAVLQSSSEKKNGKETAKAEPKMAVENGTVIAVKGKGESVTLPEAGMLAPGALEEASYKTIVIPDNSAMIGMEWLTGAKLSGKTKKISVPWPVLKAAYTPCCREPFSDDLLNKLNAVGMPETLDTADIHLMSYGMRMGVDEIRSKLPKGMTGCEKLVLLRELLTPIPEDLPITEEALLAWKCDEGKARLMWNRMIGGSVRMNNICFAGSENKIPQGTLLTLLLNLVDAPLDSKAVKLIALLDQKQLTERLKVFYLVDSHDVRTPDIS